jgi:hypothetical protein
MQSGLQHSQEQIAPALCEKWETILGIQKLPRMTV